MLFCCHCSLFTIAHCCLSYLCLFTLLSNHHTLSKSQSQPSFYCLSISSQLQPSSPGNLKHTEITLSTQPISPSLQVDFANLGAMDELTEKRLQDIQMVSDSTRGIEMRLRTSIHIVNRPILGPLVVNTYRQLTNQINSPGFGKNNSRLLGYRT